MKIKLELIDPHTKEKENSFEIEWDFVRGFISEHMNDDQVWMFLPWPCMAWLSSHE